MPNHASEGKSAEVPGTGISTGDSPMYGGRRIGTVRDEIPFRWREVFFSVGICLPKGGKIFHTPALGSQTMGSGRAIGVGRTHEAERHRAPLQLITQEDANA